MLCFPANSPICPCRCSAPPRLLPGWLNAPDLRRLILAYCHAQPQHGGSGAVYILLKRERGRGGGREGD